ncbi:snRNA-activating protein complex subunit 1-like [Cyprinodon tularosa]|uniref:snRNA-activating protein complex subunit 1-like n=1 Tax=Cyprinodon tularosa TaxID=77115 RepID=UPI0018E22BD4|nr:snRNA-activating protein complex subunit 1-like [Cyprinodon tularosa]
MDSYRKHIKSDCDALLNRFQQTQSIRFEVFSQIWKEMKFSLIFSGTPNHKKRLLFRLALNVAYSYFLPPFSFQIRVGGLYLLYSFYHCQTGPAFERICVALKDFDDIKHFEKEAVDAQHFDVVYVLKRLMNCKAFHFTAMPTHLIYRTKRSMEKSALCEQFIERASRPQELIHTHLLEEMANVDELYKNMKASCTAEMSTRESTSVNLIRPEIVSQLFSTALDFYNWQQERETTDEDKNSPEKFSSQQESSNRARLLASIKSKAFGEASETSKSRRHRPVERDLTAEEGGSFLRPRNPRVIKPSLRKRTTDQLYVTGDLAREVQRPTFINQLCSLDPSFEEKQKNDKKIK